MQSTPKRVLFFWIMQELVPLFYHQNALFYKNQRFRMHYFTKNCLLKRLILLSCAFQTYFLVSGIREKRCNINFPPQKLAHVRNIWTTLLYILNTWAKLIPYSGGKISFYNVLRGKNGRKCNNRTQLRRKMHFGTPLKGIHSEKMEEVGRKF